MGNTLANAEANCLRIGQNRVSSEIHREMERRGVSRLCHFTPIANLPSIFGRGGIHSILQAREQNISLRQMDAGRWDGQLGHVSLSLEFPNAFLMRRYGHVPMPDRPSERWVPTAVLEIDPISVDWTNALCSPVNAATARGALLGPVTAHLRTLFDREVPNELCPPRSSRHPAACPTDLQAEVMISGGVLLESIRRIFVEREIDEHDVRTMGLPVPVDRWPAIFSPDSLSAAIRGGKPPRPP